MWDHPDYDFSKAYTPAEMKRFIEEVPPVGPPGGKYYYSNSGFYLLGQVIEAVTGSTFEADLRRNVFDVAGMEDFDHLGAATMPPGTAQPYIYFSSKDWRPHAMGVSPRANPAGGWVGSAHGLYGFARSYLDGRFLDADARKTQWSANGTVDLATPGNRYGYGTEVFVDTLVPVKTIVGHSGGGGGFSVDMFMEPESGTVVVVMCNIYAMNREMSGNYLRAALDLPTKPARHSALVRTVDHLVLKGLPYLQRDPARFFAEIDVPKYSRHFLGEVAGFLQELQLADLARGVEETARLLHGEADKKG
jgi:CubicO group peptidase (beta-lactamase class C family)